MWNQLLFSGTNASGVGFDTGHYISTYIYMRQVLGSRVSCSCLKDHSRKCFRCARNELSPMTGRCNMTNFFVDIDVGLRHYPRNGCQALATNDGRAAHPACAME